jgi:hypothetical protein
MLPEGEALRSAISGKAFDPRKASQEGVLAVSVMKGFFALGNRS